MLFVNRGFSVSKLRTDLSIQLSRRKVTSILLSRVHITKFFDHLMNNAQQSPSPLPPCSLSTTGRGIHSNVSTLSSLSSGCCWLNNAWCPSYMHHTFAISHARYMHPCLHCSLHSTCHHCFCCCYCWCCCTCHHWASSAWLWLLHCRCHHHHIVVVVSS